MVKTKFLKTRSDNITRLSKSISENYGNRIGLSNEEESEKPEKSTRKNKAAIMTVVWSCGKKIRVNVVKVVKICK